MAINISRSISIYLVTITLISLYPTATTYDGPYGFYDFAKFVMEWPPSFCNNGGNDCQTPMIKHFIAKHLEPMYWPDITVPPYNESGCAEVPVPDSTVSRDAPGLVPFISSMDEYWPYLLNFPRNKQGWPTKKKMNELHWNKQWWVYGKCKVPYTDYVDFFREGLDHAGAYAASMLYALNETGNVVPNNQETHVAIDIAAAIEEYFGHKVQIRCNKDAENHLQLHEIGISLNKNQQMIDSEVQFVGCEPRDIIKFPVAV